MPFELTRKTPEELSPDAVIYAENPPAADTRRGLFGRRRDIPLPEGGELSDRYLHGLEEALARRCVRIAMTVPSPGSGLDTAVYARAALRAASIFLRGFEASVYLSVPEGLEPEGGSYGSLRDYIAARYIGLAPGGGIFERRFYRAAPDMAPTVPPEHETVEYTAPTAARPPVPSAPKRAKAARVLGDVSLQDMLEKADAGFSQTLMALIDKSGRSDPEVYKRANVDRKLFSKIRSNPAYRPSKTTALAFAVALELDMDGVRDLLSRAGYTLTHASRGDIIVEYFITRGEYDIFEINETLFAFDQPLLGGAS